ncbi:MAG: hypothetical protein M0Z36_06625 [Thermaerobacter sp.]|nr:hypothetical protein [Thermaerobacter sp.]
MELDQAALQRAIRWLRAQIAEQRQAEALRAMNPEGREEKYHRPIVARERGI